MLRCLDCSVESLPKVGGTRRIDATPTGALRGDMTHGLQALVMRTRLVWSVKISMAAGSRARSRGCPGAGTCGFTVTR